MTAFVKSPDTRELTVLTIEDEPQMRRFLRASLPAFGYRLIEASTAREGVVDAGTRNPDVILLDLGLPDADGIEVTRQLRKITNVPIVIVSARSLVGDKVSALDAGADDYLTKPFAINELLARLRVAGRRAGHRDAPVERVVVVGPLRVDLDSRLVFIDDREVHLTPTQWRLLSALVRHAGRVMTHQELLQEGWGARYGTQTEYLHVYMGQLRGKLEQDRTRPRLIITEPGVGYRLKAE